jgi:hypothetical protein
VLDGVAANDRYVFWSNDGEHVIGRANLDGTAFRSGASLRRPALLRRSLKDWLSTESTSTGRTIRPTRSHGRTSMVPASTTTSSSSRACLKGPPSLLTAARHRRRRQADAVGRRRRPCFSVRPTLSGPLRGRLGGRGACGDLERRRSGKRNRLLDSLEQLGRKGRCRSWPSPGVHPARRLLPKASGHGAPRVRHQALQAWRSSRIHALHRQRGGKTRRPDGKMVRMGVEHVRRFPLTR